MKTASEDQTIDTSLVSFDDEGSAYCAVHGAMNLQNGVWRCFTLYCGPSDGSFPKGVKQFKFVNRVCNAGFVLPKGVSYG